MILVKFENENIRLQAVELWHEAFGDSREYIKFFLDSHEACTCLSYEENGKLCSMLFLIDGTLCGKSAYYLFAAATFKSERGKGCMAKLLEKAKNYAVQNGRAYIVLVPAEPSLFDYYLRFGYKTCFYAKRQGINEEFELDKSMCFVWDKAHEEYIKAESEKFGAAIYEKSGMLFSVYGEKEIKVPVKTADEKYRYGMALSLDKDVSHKNFYIGLTLDG